MPALGELAALACPQTVAEPAAALGQPDRDLLPRGHAYLGCDELIAWPILARIFVIGEAGNAPLLHLREERGAVALPIKHNGEAVQQRVGVEFIGAWLVGDVGFEARHDIANQPGADELDADP